jgi:hypothetical protein
MMAGGIVTPSAFAVFRLTTSHLGRLLDRDVAGGKRYLRASADLLPSML